MNNDKIVALLWHMCLTVEAHPLVLLCSLAIAMGCGGSVGGGTSGSGGQSAGSSGAAGATSGAAGAAGGGGSAGSAGSGLTDSGGGAAGGGGSSSSCNAIVNSAPSIVQTQVAQELPTGAGGTIADATYFRTSFDLYTGVGGPTGSTGRTCRKVLVVSYFSGHVDTVESCNGNNDNRMSFITFIGGTTIGLHLYCPVDFPGPAYQYTVSSNDLTLISSDSKTVEIFTRQ